jgi:mRNA interferase MazF
VTSDAPDRGDYVHVDFDPQAGHEQKGRGSHWCSPTGSSTKKPGWLLSRPSLATKGYPFEAPLPPGDRVSGVVLADQTRSLDWRARRLKVKGKASEGVVEEVTALLSAILCLDADS